MNRIRELIDHAVLFHRLLASYFAVLLEHATDSRLRLILDYLAEHEKASEEYLVEYGRAASPDILDTWIQFSSCESKLVELRRILLEKKHDVNDIVDTLMQFYECFIEQFQGFALQAENENAREVFQNIVSHEENGKKQLIRNLGMLYDI